jgi:alkylation response protein AidB-like acyl-CoA dehydrogenase
MTMALVLSEDETMLADAARGLIARTAPVAAFRRMRDEGVARRFDPALLGQFAANGLIAPNASSIDGGAGMGVTAAGVIAEQAGRTLAAAPLLSAAMAADILGRIGSEAQKARLLPEITAGREVVATALEESSRHDPAQLDSVATETATGWTLSGSKTAVIDGFGAAAFIVSARVGADARLFLVTGDATGLSIAAIDTIDTRNLARLTLDAVPAEPLGEGDAAVVIAASYSIGRALLAAELLGLADEMFDRTISYLKQRVQFGRTIGSFQALQHRAARLYARLDMARGPVLKALRAIDGGDGEAAQLASLAKAVLTRLARDVAAEAVQMHGGIGVTDEFDIGLFFKRARTAGELLGDDLFHIERLARERWQL